MLNNGTSKPRQKGQEGGVAKSLKVSDRCHELHVDGGSDLDGRREVLTLKASFAILLWPHQKTIQAILYVRWCGRYCFGWFSQILIFETYLGQIVEPAFDRWASPSSSWPFASSTRVRPGGVCCPLVGGKKGWGQKCMKDASNYTACVQKSQAFILDSLDPRRKLCASLCGFFRSRFCFRTLWQNPPQSSQHLPQPNSFQNPGPSELLPGPEVLPTSSPTPSP